MQQHFSSEESKPFVQPAESNPMVQSRIDAYLTRTCAPLFVSLPQEEALQQRAEMQSHLESLVVAHIELGYSETEAVTLALEQFGKEQSVAKAWKQECETTQVERGNGTILSALRPVVGYSLLNWTLFPLLAEFYSFLINGYSRMGARPSSLLMYAAIFVFLGEFTLFPAFLGYLVGRRARGHTLAIALLALPFTVTLCTSLVFKVYNGFHMFLPPPGRHYEPPAVVALYPLAIYLGFGALGVGAALLRRRRTLRLAGNR
ncbi:MAG: hypothetical protein JWN14_1209 [Chthonomonadales bacterium]|nr:hypothetical protein [Chthonomonadales bacterium]